MQLCHHHYRYNAKTKMVTTLIGTPGAIGSADSVDPSAATLHYPTGLALCSARKSLFIADRGNNCTCCRASGCAVCVCVCVLCVWRGC